MNGGMNDPGVLAAPTSGRTSHPTHSADSPAPA